MSRGLKILKLALQSANAAILDDSINECEKSPDIANVAENNDVINLDNMSSNLWDADTTILEIPSEHHGLTVNTDFELQATTSNNVVILNETQLPNLRLADLYDGSYYTIVQELDTEYPIIPCESADNMIDSETDLVQQSILPDVNYDTFNAVESTVDYLCSPSGSNISDNGSDTDYVPNGNSTQNSDDSIENESQLEDNASNMEVYTNKGNKIKSPKIRKAIVPYSDSNGETDHEETVIINNETRKNKRKRHKRHEVREERWHSKKSQADREKGLPYCGRRKINNRWRYDVKKEARVLKDRCKCVGGKKTKMDCAAFTEDDRKQMFENFWLLSWKERKIYVNLLVEQKPIARARDRKEEYKSRRKYTFNYYLRNGNKVRNRVCKKMFINTFGISEWSVLEWTKKNKTKEMTPNDNPEIDSDENAKEPSGYTSRQKPFVDRLQSLTKFFDKLAKMESHYCRASSNKLYLEPNWRSKWQLYKFYTNEWCKQENNLKPLSIATFSNTFQQMNLSLFRPKKDECDLCVAYQTKNLTEVQYLLHQEKKKEARMEKEHDKDNEKYVFTMDLQSVLLCPFSNVSSLYFKTKLTVHNFCLYNLKTKDGFCYLWNETEGGLTAHEFSSIISNFIITLLPLENPECKIILYSDGCTYQNRNCVLANTLLNMAILHNIIIEQKILEKGHTQMEADSMHSTIERQLRDRKINIPADYVEVCREARKKPKPYTVQYLEHSFFKNFQNLQFYNSIRPGRSAGDPMVTDIRALQYKPDGTINYKLRFTDEWSELPARKNKKMCAQRLENIPNLYKERQKIEKIKFDHLQVLKQSLDSDYHSYYDNIPHHN